MSLFTRAFLRQSLCLLFAAENSDWLQQAQYFTVTPRTSPAGVTTLLFASLSSSSSSRMTKLVIAKRLSWVPEAARIKDVDEDLLAEYVFQVMGGRRYGPLAGLP